MASIGVELFQGQRNPTEDDDIALGRLLGYGEEDIQTFLRHVKLATDS